MVALLSLAGLVWSADVAISQAVLVARHFRVSPLIIGTTLVAMSTSMAELAVNMAVTLSGGDNRIVVGNILGSNLVNIGIGLGAAALFVPIRTATLVIEREILLYFGVTALLTAFLLDRMLGRSEGVVLVACFGLVLFLIYQYARAAPPDAGTATEEIASPGRGLVIAGAALIGLVVSAEVLVESVTVLARAAGISSYIIGLTIVGIGTSLPEIATSIQAARRGHVDLVLGNVFGSNVFNICIALGLPALIRPIHVTSSALDDVWFINLFGIGVVFLLLADSELLGERKVINQWSGILIAVAYAAYIAFKVATGAR